MKIYKSNLPRDKRDRILAAMKYLAKVNPSNFKIKYNGPCIVLYEATRTEEYYRWARHTMLFYYES